MKYNQKEHAKEHNVSKAHLAGCVYSSPGILALCVIRIMTTVTMVTDLS